MTNEQENQTPVSHITYSEEIFSMIQQLRMIDDAFFRVLATDEGFCEEILQTLLHDQQLRVLSANVQYNIKHFTRGVALDALCELADGTLCNIEVQKSDKHCDVKRVRHHAGIVTVSHTKANTKFADIPDVIIIYISDYDILGNGNMLTQIQRCHFSDNVWQPIEDGEMILLFNVSSTEETPYSKLARLFLTTEVFDVPDYPVISAAVSHYKTNEVGISSMSSKLETFVKKYEERAKLEGKLEGKIEGKLEGKKEGELLSRCRDVQDGDYTPDRAAAKLGISLNEFEHYYEEFLQTGSVTIS
jgi:hypothetical protein